MNINRCIKKSFSVIGKEGSTKDGENFIDKLWKDANSHFNEVCNLAKRDNNENLLGIWGIMSDFSRNYNPWENNFTEGLYLAGVEVIDDSETPPSWVKWTIPSYEYLYVKVDECVKEVFSKVLNYMDDNNLTLAGAVHDYMCPEEDGQLYMFFPIKKL